MKRVKLTSALMALIMALSVLFVSCDLSSLIEPMTQPESNISSEKPTIEETSLDETSSDETSSDETASKETNTDETEVTELIYDGSEVTITFYHTMGMRLRDVLDYYIVEFNKLYPNITVAHSQEGGYDDVRDKISSEIPTGLQPNLAYCYPDHVALYNTATAVAPLDGFINSRAEITDALGNKTAVGFTDEQKADFITAFYEDGKQYGDGQLYTLPMSKSTDLLYYNKTFFDKHNLKVPTTWDEMEAVMAQIKAIDPSCIPLGYDSESNWFINMCMQSGSPYTSAVGDHFLFDNETNRAFVKRFSEWYSKGYVITQELYGSYTSSLFTETRSDNVKCYMSIASSGGATFQRPDKDYNGEYPFDVGIATIPQVDPANRKVIMQGPSLCMFNGHSDQEMAATWLFMKFLTTNSDFQAEFSMTSGYIPAIRSAAEHPVYKNYLAAAEGGNHITAYTLKTCLAQSDSYCPLPAFVGSAKAREEVGYIMQNCMAGYKNAADKEKLIAEAFKAAVSECTYLYGTSSNPTGSFTEEQALANATSYLKNMYRSFLSYTETSYDFEVIPSLKIAGVDYTVTWTVDNDAVKVVKAETGMIIIDIDERSDSDIEYTLTAVVSNVDGTKGAPLSFKLMLPKADAPTAATETELVEGTVYKLFMDQKNINKVVFATNKTQNDTHKYVLTTQDPASSADFQVEKTTGGYKIYTMIDGVKNYLYSKVEITDEGRANKYIGFSADNASVYRYHADVNAWFTTINGTEYVVGTYSTYETISLSEAVYISPDNTGITLFPLAFMTKDSADKFEPPADPADPTELTSIADFVAIANSLENKGVSTIEKYLVQGTVTEIVNETYGNMYITDGQGNTLYIYGLYNKDGSVRYDHMDNQPAVGDTVTLMGVAQNYNGAQMKNAHLQSIDVDVNTEE